MNDPLASFTAPPPRYLLESDSSDEEGQGLYPILGQPSRPPRAPVVPHHYTVHPAGTQTYESVIVGIGQAGRYAARCLGIDSRRPGEVRLLDGDALVGQGYEVDGRLFMMLDETGPSGDGAHELSESLLSSLKAKRWSVTIQGNMDGLLMQHRVLSTSYLAALYIPDSEDPTATQDDSVIRFLHSGSQPDASPATMAKAGLRPLDSPNYVSGYAAALASLVSVAPNDRSPQGSNALSDDVVRDHADRQRPHILHPHCRAIHPSLFWPCPCPSRPSPIKDFILHLRRSRSRTRQRRQGCGGLRTTTSRIPVRVRERASH